MVDAIPPWYAKLDLLVGTQEVRDAAKIVAFAGDIGRAFPEMSAYAHLMKDPHTKSWCGYILGAMFALFAIRPPYDPSDDLKSFMWVDSWETFGTPVAIGQEQLGDVMILKDTAIHHVDLFAKRNDDGTYDGLGGNQGDSIRHSNYNVAHIHMVRRPHAPVNSAPVNSLPITLDSATIAAIVAAAASSDLAHWSWDGRGRAPIGYIQGMAVAYAQALQRLAAGDSVSHAMVRFVDSPTEHDVFDQYADILTGAGMVTLGSPDVDRLRILFVILTGLGMRESSGGSDIGADRQAGINRPAEELEAGPWQQSWNSHATSPELPKLLNAYRDTQADAIDAIFMQGVNIRAGSMESFGDGDNRIFQDLAKARPSFAVQAAAIGLRTLSNAWGPINRHEVEIVPAADALFRQVEEIVNAQPAPQTQSAPQGPAPVTDTPAAPAPINPAPQPTATLPDLIRPDLSKFADFFENQAELAQKEMIKLNGLWYILNPSRPVGAGTTQAAPTPAPLQGKTLGDLLTLPSVQVGTGGAIIAGLVHWIGVVDPNLTMGATILSAATAALGVTGIWGRIASGALTMVWPIIKAAIARQQAQQQQDSQNQQPPK